MGFEEIKAGLEKYTVEIEGKLVKKVDKVNFDEVEFETPKYDFPFLINFSVGKPGRVKTVCPCCGSVHLVSRIELAFKRVFPLICKNCTKRIIAVHKELIAKGYVFKHGFEKVV